MSQSWLTLSEIRIRDRRVHGMRKTKGRERDGELESN